MTRVRRGQRFRDVFLKAGSPIVERLPARERAGGLRAYLNKAGVIPTRAHAEIERIGRRLFKRLVPNAKEFRGELEAARRSTPKRRSRIWLLLDGATGGQPWELLADGAGGAANFLSRDRETLVVRTLARPSNDDTLKGINGPLRVLAVLASPMTLEPLNIPAEKRALMKALAEPLRQKLVEIEWVQGRDTARQLRERLRKSWHVVHFVGHGDFDPSLRMGVLAFEDRNGRPHPLDASVFGQMLSDRGIRLVVLNSCRGAFAGNGVVLASTAGRLAQRVPAVVGMQTSITDKGAVEFASEFYGSLFRGLSVEEAVTEARLWLAAGGATTGVIEWPAPVVYLSSLFDVLKLGTVKGRPGEGGGKLRSARRMAVAAVEPAPRAKRRRPAPEDDPQKYQWGESAKRNGRTLSATVERLDKDWFQIDLKVTPARGTRRLTDPVTFHLHDSFDEPVRVVEPIRGVAKLRLVAYGAFTVGVEADRGRTRLELDLATIERAPRAFRES